MSVEIILTHPTVHQHNLYNHAYPNYQALFRTHRAYVSSNGRLVNAHNRS